MSVITGPALHMHTAKRFKRWRPKIKIDGVKSVKLR